MRGNCYSIWTWKGWIKHCDVLPQGLREARGTWPPRVRTRGSQHDRIRLVQAEVPSAAVGGELSSRGCRLSRAWSVFGRNLLATPSGLLTIDWCAPAAASPLGAYSPTNVCRTQRGPNRRWALTTPTRISQTSQLCTKLTFFFQTNFNMILDLHKTFSLNALNFISQLIF